MSYDSAILFKIENQENVNEESFLEFASSLREKDLLPFSQEDEENKSVIDYFYFDEETDEEEESEEEIASIQSVKDFIKGKKLEFCSISISEWGQELEKEFNIMLKELDKNEDSYLQPAWKFGYGFGNVLDPVAGEYSGWSFFIETSDYVPEFELLEKAFGKQLQPNLLSSITSSLEEIFDSKIVIEGCLTG